MASVNKQILIGNLGKDPELRQTASGKAVCNFSVATTEKRGGEEETTWHNVVAWEKNAENAAKYLKKGSSVYVEGRTTKRKYEKDGQQRESVEVVADKVTFLGGKKTEGDGWGSDNG